MNTYFDIETSAMDMDKLLSLRPTFEANKTLKDPEKIKIDLANKEAEWLEKAALHAHTGKVIAIGLLQGDNLCMNHGDNEKDMIEQFWQVFNASELSSKFIGHNCKAFDVPFLVRRSYILGIKIPNIMNGRYLLPRFTDTMEAWAAGTRDMISLDTLAKALGVGAKTGEGKYFSETYKNNKEEALDYLTNDLKLTKACAERMGL